MLYSTPRGFRDVLPAEALAREQIADTVRAVFSAHGYLPVETPLLESRAVLERAGRIKGTPFQLIDADDDLLMLRPDVTLPIARMVASRIDGAQLPLRLRYQAPVVREQASLKGAARQFTQMGVELIGGTPINSEIEVLGLLGEALAALGVTGYTIALGSVRPLAALVEAAQIAPALKTQLYALVHQSNLVSFDEALAGASLVPEMAAALGRLVRLRGDIGVLQELRDLLVSAGVSPEAAGVAELEVIAEAAANALGRGALTFDFSTIGSFDYYTGLIFKAYVPGVATSLASGGRYDALLANVDTPAESACGFSFSLERMQEALETRASQPGPLRIAIPKGSLLAPTLELLEAAGLPTEELKSPGRRLIIAAGDVEYVIVRASDAPAFVAYGGADCGICGSDSLFEADLELIELLDLGYGACHFVVAEPAAAAGLAEQKLAREGSIRVATKYPRITQAYYNRIGCAVDIVALHGNIELGPIVGIADRIVDITATGATLKENHLAIVDDNVMACSARFFANPAAYRTDPRVAVLAAKFANQN